VKFVRSVLVGVALVLAHGWVQAVALISDSYDVTVQTLCPEGYVSCDRLVLRGVHKLTGRRLHLKGRSMHSMCADGVTPCRYLGDQFEGRSYVYFFSSEGWLLVKDSKGRLLLREKYREVD
jgi:hypothetical protein